MCDKLREKLAENLNMDICKTLNNNKYEINFMNSGVNDVLDEVVESFEKVEQEKFDLCKFFDEYVNIGEGKGKTTENMTKNSFYRQRSYVFIFNFCSCKSFKSRIK